MKSNKLVCGVGINDADYPLNKSVKVNSHWQTVWKCPYYSRWAELLTRCYSQKRQQRTPAYIGCSVCDEWLIFSNFRKWMEKQNECRNQWC